MASTSFSVDTWLSRSGYSSDIKIRATLTVSETGTPNVASNASYVSYTVTVQQVSGSGYSGTTSSNAGSLNVKINGTTYTHSVATNSGQQQTRTYRSSSNISIPHDKDGTKTISVSMWFGSVSLSSGFSYQSTSATNKSLTLTTIARGTTPTLSASSVELGKPITITLNPATSTFKHSLSYALPGGVETNVLPNGTTYTSPGNTTVTFTPALNEANGACIANSDRATAILKCVTYDSSNNEIQTINVNVTIKVPSTVVPTFSGEVSVTDLNPTVVSWGANIHVQTISRLRFNATASGAYGSTIKSYKLVFDDIETSSVALPIDTTSVSKWGNVAYTLTATDTRDRSVSKTGTVSIIEYHSPAVFDISSSRTDNEHTAEDEGTSARFDFSYNICPVTVNGVNKNSFTLTLQMQDHSVKNAPWTDIGTWSPTNGYTTTITTFVDDRFVEDYTYGIRLLASDTLSVTRLEVPFPDITQTSTLLNFGKSGFAIAIGGVSSDDGTSTGLFESYYPSKFYDSIEIKKDIYNHHAKGASGSGGFIRFAKIKFIPLASSYANVPISFALTRRGDALDTRCTISFSSSKDYTAERVRKFYTVGPASLFYSVANEGDDHIVYLYVLKLSDYDDIGYYDLRIGPYMLHRIEWTWIDNHYTTLPVECVAAENSSGTTDTVTTSGSRTSYPTDYILEQGKKNVTFTCGSSTYTMAWSYRKWRNGSAECWGQANITQSNTGTQWGTSGLYQGDILEPIPYPFDFVEPPSENVTATGANSSNNPFWVFRETGNVASNTTSATTRVRPLKVNAFVSGPLIISYHVIGWWQ